MPRILLVALVRYTCDAETNAIGKNNFPVGISPFLTLAHLTDSRQKTEAPPAFDFPSSDSRKTGVDSSSSASPKTPSRVLAPLPSAKRHLDLRNEKSENDIEDNSPPKSSSRKSLHFFPSPLRSPCSNTTTTTTTNSAIKDQGSRNSRERRSSVVGYDFDKENKGYDFDKERE